MPTASEFGPAVPSPSREDWLDWLYWLAERVSARDIVHCIEKPHKWVDYYEDYLAAGGLER